MAQPFVPIPLPSGRVAFVGSRHAGGYKTADDAVVEFRAQVTNVYAGSLNTGPLYPDANVAAVIDELAGDWS